jgi:DNA repair protein RecN (Recombination protein N)
MIKHLHIRNFAIIEELDMAFPQGLTIITGETGAGKSILLGALGLIMGKRADIKSLHNLQSKCVVEALFDTSAYELTSFFSLPMSWITMERRSLSDVKSPRLGNQELL